MGENYVLDIIWIGQFAIPILSLSLIAVALMKKNSIINYWYVLAAVLAVSVGFAILWFSDAAMGDWNSYLQPQMVVGWIAVVVSIVIALSKQRINRK